jgi:hypothetical protein
MGSIDGIIYQGSGGAIAERIACGCTAGEVAAKENPLA